MFRFLTIGIVATVVFGFLGGLSIYAQNRSPLVVPPTVQIPAVPQAQPAVEKKIREALDAERQSKDSGDLQTGDIVLDDVLGIIRQRGSVLDGSSLDESPDVVQPAVIDHSVAQSHPAAKAHAAEQLLKSARMLEGIGPRDSQEKERRTDLIRKIRVEAAKLLSE